MTASSPTYQSGLFKHSVILLVATQIGNVSNLLFQVLMIRSLSLAEYGILASMLSLILIIGTPLDALRTTVAHQTAWLLRGDQGGAIVSFLWRWARFLMVIACVILVAGVLMSAPVSQFFQMPSRAPFLLSVIIMATSLFIPFFAGAFQGMQAFGWMAAHGQVWGVIRYVLALFLVMFIAQSAVIGLSAHAAGVVVSFLVGLFALIFLLKPHRPAELTVQFSDISYFWLSLLSMVGFAVLMNADVALVKRFFSPDDAGVFAQAATIGRAIIFLPLPIAGAMFPKVVSTGKSSSLDRRILKLAILYTLGIIALSGLICTLAASPLWLLFTGDVADDRTKMLVRWMIWAMAPMGLTFLLMNYELAQRRFRAPLSLLALAALYVIGVAVWHDTFEQVLTILSIVSVTSLLVMLFDALRKHHHENRF